MARTLVVDDEPDILEFVVLVLSRAGHEVTHVGDGAEALDLLAADRFDVVVVDHHMPRVTGADIVRHVARTSPGTRTLLMSGDHDAWLREPGVATVSAFLPKPFDLTSLVHAVHALVDPPMPSSSG